MMLLLFVIAIGPSILLRTLTIAMLLVFVPLRLILKFIVRDDIIRQPILTPSCGGIVARMRNRGSLNYVLLFDLIHPIRGGF